MTSRGDRPTPSELRRAIEDERRRGRARGSAIPRVARSPARSRVGRVDAGPTGERLGGYREATPARRIIIVGITVIVVIAAVLAIALLWQNAQP